MNLSIFLPYSGNDFLKESLAQKSLRINWMCDLSANADNRDIHIYPAGWLSGYTPSEALKIADETVGAIRKSKIHANVFFGVDGRKNGGKGSKNTKSSIDGYPMWVYWVLSDGDKFSYQQIAVSASENIQSLTPRKSININGKKISILICGETMVSSLRERVENESPELVLILAHQAVPLGDNPSRSWEKRIKELRQITKSKILLSEHTRDPKRHNHMWGVSPANGNGKGEWLDKQWQRGKLSDVSL